MIRIYLSFVLFIVSFVVPWWLFILITFLLTFFFGMFHESILMAIVLDITYFPRRDIFIDFDIGLYLTIFTLVICSLALLAKKRLNIYTRIKI